ncbi:hypothetical protein [Afipia sp. GAS231]|uniref:hypothetical protein n=1 Tax=Afipia sp. GAS231 TaxID=1882747 RepID=UPI00087D7227|nr:hypothetical protein [Afipia sp. GAS231]SDP49442.1 hypothetical protein SAMN05444050_7051 [Afipia sp. GAS231]
MTLQEALAIAAQAKPKHQHRQPLDKLQGSSAAAQLATDATALSKRFDSVEETASSLQKRVDQIAADVEYLENFKPGAPARKPLQ